MSAKRIVFKLTAAAAVLAIAAGVFGNLSARVRPHAAIPQDTQAVADVASPNRVVEPNRIAFSATVQARAANALEAKWRLEEHIDSISKVTMAQGGKVTLGDARYLRTRDAGGELARQAETGFWIVQQLDIELPEAADRARLEAVIARRDRATPE